jgi:hypothetical protein
VSDRLREAVPVEVQDDVRESAPVGRSDPTLLQPEPERVVANPLVEPMETFDERLKVVAELTGPIGDLLSPGPLADAVSHREFHGDLTVNQGGRGSCWAWAGIAALEAAYARTGVRVTLSPHYLFHMSKAHENHRANGGIHSLVGFQGSSNIVHHMTHFSVPLADWVPYIDQGPLQALANSIPNTGMALSGSSGSGTREQADWIEFDLRHIPLWGRWFAQYGVAEYGQLTNFTNDDIKRVVKEGYDVVVDVFDSVNNGGHVLVIIGYDNIANTFAIKNSQFSPGFGTMRYTSDPQFTILYNTAFYITKVKPVASQWPALWVGRWETDHDGWRGMLVIRRFTDLFAAGEIPGPDSRISLGTWYGETGAVLDVVGHFDGGGRSLHCDIGGQAFELYLHTKDAYRAAGRAWWNDVPFGVVMSRGTATGAGSGFDRSESIGFWDMTHDGWHGTLRIGVEPSYVQALDSVPRPTWIDPGLSPHQIDTHVSFGDENPDQYFQVLVHTREDALYGGVTSWADRAWPVEGRMSRNLYTITPDGTLRWYRHDGRGRLAADWTGPNIVGSGWESFTTVFGGGDGVSYGVRPNGDLLWYYHDGRNQGGGQWLGPSQVGTGWNGFTRVFAGDGGVIYGVTTDARLLWYRHLSRRDGGQGWLGPFEVGTGWDGFTTMTAAPDGCVYGVQPDGTLLWYRHYGHDQGYPIWHGPVAVGSGWQGFDRIWAAGNGYIYGRTAADSGDLFLWRHHGFLTGETTWTEGVKVGNGWGGDMREVFAT